MGTKVTEMQEAQQVNDNDLLMVVQNGANKKVKAEKFVRKGESIDNAKTLDGYTAEDFLKSDDTARNADKLGGIEANQYPTKDELPAYIASVKDPTWCRPIIWVGAITDEMANVYHYHECDGSPLDKDEYPELFQIIGYMFTRDKDGNEVAGQMFLLPDLRGRFPLGSTKASYPIKTMDLPQGLYSGKNFDENGQMMIPTVIGDKGGSMTVTQDDITQMVIHDHEVNDVLDKSEYTTTGSAGSSTKGLDSVSWVTRSTRPRGFNDSSTARYPDKGSQYNYGMPAMPPYLSVRFIMKIKP